MPKTTISLPCHLPVYLIFPAYNEEATIAHLLEEYRQAFPHPDTRFHVVVNNTRDNTAAECAKVQASDPRILVTDIPEAIGKGGAVIYGFQQYDELAPVIGFVDSDGSVNTLECAKLVTAIHAHPADRPTLVMGSRWIEGSAMVVKQPISRRVNSRLFNLTVRTMFGFPYGDTQCGAKFLNRNAALRIRPHLKERSFTFDIELLWLAKQKGLTIHEVPIDWHDSDRASSVKPLKILVPVTKSLVRIRTTRVPHE